MKIPTIITWRVDFGVEKAMYAEIEIDNQRLCNTIGEILRDWKDMDWKAFSQLPIPSVDSLDSTKRSREP